MTWDLNSPAGIELASPALKGRFLNAGPEGVSQVLMKDRGAKFHRAGVWKRAYRLLGIEE